MSKACSRGVSPCEVSNIRIVSVKSGRDNLIAWVSCLLSGTMVLNNIGVRRGRDGELFLTYPNKVTATGARVTLFHPVSSDAAAVLDAAIVGKVRELIGPSEAPRSSRAR